MSKTPPQDELTDPVPSGQLRRVGRIPFQTPRVIFALLLREMNTTFGRSSLGYLWALLEPLGAIAVLTIAFSIIFKEPPLGTDFALFYASGYLPFALYNAGQSKISAALTQNKALLFYPAVTYIDVILARVILIGLTDITVALIVCSGLMLLFETGARPDVPLLLAGFGMALMVGTAIGLMNATLFVIFPSWRSIWKILSRPMFFISAIFYTFESLPEYIQQLLWWNPLIHITGTLRLGFYPEYEGSYVTPLYVIFFSLIAMAIGLVNLRTSNKFIINN